MLPVTSGASEHAPARTVGVGIIGLGDRGCFVLGARLRELREETGLEIVALCDHNPQRIADAQAFLGPEQRFHTFTDYHELISDPAVELVLITTHTYAHREPAIAALEAGKRVYLDKPISVEPEDAFAIRAAEEATGNSLIMGFTRRYESSWVRAAQLLREGAIGDLQMMQIRSLIPYTRYLQMWHRERRYSGGALNDKSSHHLDVFNWLAGDRCESVVAMGGRSGIFAPDPTAPPYCAVCDRDCPYRRQAGASWNKEGSQVLDYPSWQSAGGVLDRADTCVFLPGSDIEDHVAATYHYRNGVTASLFWAIFGPPAEDQETLELLGSSGRLVLTRSTGMIDLYSDYGRSHEQLDARGPDFDSSHYGADLELVRALRRFVDGAAPPVGSLAGIESLRMIGATQASLDAGGERQTLVETSGVTGT